MADDKFLILNINGGAGKNVLATAVVKAIKKATPDIKVVVLTAYKDIWSHNPYVYRIYQHGVMGNYFHSDYIKGKDTKILAIDPYTTEDYLLQKKHLIEIWCDLAGVKYNNEKPELFFNQREVDYVKRRFLDNRKIFLIQTNGGFNQEIKISWMRDMPLDLAQEVVNNFMNEYRVIHIRREDQPALMGTEPFNGSLRDLALLVRFSEKRFLIDSVCQHMASALNKPSTVLWVRNSPEILGYPVHDNIVTDAEDEIDTLSNSLFEPYDIAGMIYQCPFKEGTVLFDKKKVIESIKNQKPNK